jgi:phosphoribosyl 1,2-cyclic phosphodiesterase
MQVRFFGVRGSTPATGPDFVRYGGDTSCVGIALDGAAVPQLLLDAGTGLRNLSPVLAGGAFAGTLVLTHLHWDHVQGLPFFPPGDRPDAQVHALLPAQGGRSGLELLSQLMSPPAFPITPAELGGTWRFDAIEAGEAPVDASLGCTVRTFDVTHKGGRTFGCTVAHDGRRVAYVPDHAPALGITDVALEELRGVDLLIHGGQMVEAERHLADAYGHGTIGDALALAERVGAGRLVLSHHSPGRTDDRLDEIAADLPDGVGLARQGLVVEV